MHLSPHFTLAEAGRSMTAQRLGIDNTPPAALEPALRHVAETILEPVRLSTGCPFSPTSRYRCRDLNTAVGGAPNSRHLTGEAVDIEVPGVPNDALARWIALNLTFDQLILEYFKPGWPASGWVHVAATAGGPNRGQVLWLRPGIGLRTGLPARPTTIGEA